MQSLLEWVNGRNRQVVAQPRLAACISIRVHCKAWHGTLGSIDAEPVRMQHATDEKYRNSMIKIVVSSLIIQASFTLSQEAGPKLNTHY